MTGSRPLNIAILWHMHQPMYREPGARRLMLPWVRLHGTKDYLDMVEHATRYERVRVTFNLVPSLIDQIELYAEGGTDIQLELSRIPAHELTRAQKREILETFFAASFDRLIRPFSRYRALFEKRQDTDGDMLPDLFTSDEMRDLQVWANLAWCDPLYRNREPLRTLFAKGRQFTEEEKNLLLDWQVGHLDTILPGYADAFKQGRIDLSFTPYYHPILPLLCDTDVAREASPDMTLPAKRFRHPEDAALQIRRSVEKFRTLFGEKMVGMWPSEGSVSETVADIARQEGLEWIASDDEVLVRSMAKSGLQSQGGSPHAVYQLPNGLRLFFRDHALSDRIGFVYAGWEAERAVRDFIEHLLRIREILSSDLDHAVVPIILDGENAWEYYENDGTAFLDLLYRSLHEEPRLQCVTMTDAARTLVPRSLPRLFAGSWINHNFRVWIGHDEDNRAWDLLSDARSAWESAAADGKTPADQLERAKEQILIAEGSDWCWWYGDDHRGEQNALFDSIYRRHLGAVYEHLSLPVPNVLDIPITIAAQTRIVHRPEAFVSPVIDGRVTHYYEWAGAGSLEQRTAGGAMHRVTRQISGILYGYDSEYIYLRIDGSFRRDGASDEVVTIELVLRFSEGERRYALATGQKREFTDGAVGAFGEIMELAVPRTTGDFAGPVSVTARLKEQDALVQEYPEGEPLIFAVPALSRELFWPV